MERVQEPQKKGFPGEAVFQDKGSDHQKCSISAGRKRKEIVEPCAQSGTVRWGVGKCSSSSDFLGTEEGYEGG